MQVISKRVVFAAVALTFAIAATNASAAVCRDTECDGPQLGSQALVKLASADAPMSLSKFAKKQTAATKPASKKVAAAKSKASKGVIARGVSKQKTVAADDPPQIPDASKLPPRVANANAALGDGLASAQASPSSESVNGVQIAAADQLNDIDRALSEATPAAEAPATTIAEAPVAQDAPAVTAPRIQSRGQTVGQSFASNQSTWDQTSLIGKLFIAVGALLTLGSVARMFLA